MAPPGPVKIGHKKDGRQRRPHRFHVSQPPPYPAAGSATEPLFHFVQVSAKILPNSLGWHPLFPVCEILDPPLIFLNTRRKE